MENGRVKLNLSPEQLCKGFVELPYSWFEENNLVPVLKAALEKQVKALINNKTFNVVPTPEDKQLMSSRIIIGVKTTSDGYLKRVKCRYVPRGFKASDYRAGYLRKDSEVCTPEGLCLMLQKC